MIKNSTQQNISYQTRTAVKGVESLDLGSPILIGKNAKRMRFKEWELKNPEKMKEYRLKYEKSPHGIKVKKAYLKRNKNRIEKWRKEWRKKNPEKGKQYYEKYKKYFPEKLEKKNFQSRVLLGRYKISFEEYKKLKEKQKGLCAICGGKNKSGRSLAIDHNHTTGKIRELLCHRCNVAIGFFGDSIELLEKTIIYLQKHQ